MSASPYLSKIFPASHSLTSVTQSPQSSIRPSRSSLKYITLNLAMITPHCYTTCNFITHMTLLQLLILSVLLKFNTHTHTTPYHKPLQVLCHHHNHNTPPSPRLITYHTNTSVAPPLKTVPYHQSHRRPIFHSPSLNLAINKLSRPPGK